MVASVANSCDMKLRLFMLQRWHAPYKVLCIHRQPKLSHKPQNQQQGEQSAWFDKEELQRFKRCCNAKNPVLCLRWVTVGIWVCCLVSFHCPNVPVKLKLQHPPPRGNPPHPRHLNFWKIFGKFLPHRAEKLFKCPLPPENYQITVLTFQ